jgi:hypothetical protein
MLDSVELLEAVPTVQTERPAVHVEALDLRRAFGDALRLPACRASSPITSPRPSSIERAGRALERFEGQNGPRPSLYVWCGRLGG